MPIKLNLIVATVRRQVFNIKKLFQNVFKKTNTAIHVYRYVLFDKSAKLWFGFKRTYNR
jgi:hypothetical protein